MGSTITAQDLETARAQREQAQAALEATIQKQAHEDATLGATVRRLSREMRQHNHIYDDVMTQLRGGA